MFNFNLKLNVNSKLRWNCLAKILLFQLDVTVPEEVLQRPKALLQVSLHGLVEVVPGGLVLHLLHVHLEHSEHSKIYSEYTV